MANLFIFNPVTRFVWVMAIFILAVCGFHYIYRGLEKDTKEERILMFGFAAFWFGLFFTRLFFYFSDYYVNLSESEHTFYGDFSDVISPTYEFFIQSGYISWLIGFSLLLFALEKIVHKTRYSLTFFNLAAIIITIILPFELSRTFIYIVDFIDGFIIVFILLWFSKKSSKEVQAVSTFIFIGLFLFMLGTTLDSIIVKSLNIFNPLIAPSLIIIGTLIAMSPTIINLEFFSRSIINWIMLLIFNSIIMYLFFHFIYSYEVPLFAFGLGWIFIILNILLITYSSIRIIRIFKPSKVIIKSIEKGDEDHDFLRSFTKPKKITEEEVAFYRTQKICLVCKGKIGGYNNFICYNCDALYCEKCARALSIIENTCWVCETVIDESKPVKVHDEVSIVKEDIDIKKKEIRGKQSSK